MEINSKLKYIAGFVLFVVLVLVGIYAVNYNICKFLGI